MVTKKNPDSRDRCKHLKTSKVKGKSNENWSAYNHFKRFIIQTNDVNVIKCIIKIAFPFNKNLSQFINTLEKALPRRYPTVIYQSFINNVCLSVGCRGLFVNQMIDWLIHSFFKSRSRLSTKYILIKLKFKKSLRKFYLTAQVFADELHSKNTSWINVINVEPVCFFISFIFVWSQFFSFWGETWIIIIIIWLFFYLINKTKKINSTVLSYELFSFKGIWLELS